MHCGQMFSDNTESEITLSITFLPAELAKSQPVKCLSEGEPSISSPPLSKLSHISNKKCIFDFFLAKIKKSQFTHRLR